MSSDEVMKAAMEVVESGEVTKTALKSVADEARVAAFECCY